MPTSCVGDRDEIVLELASVSVCLLALLALVLVQVPPERAELLNPDGSPGDEGSPGDAFVDGIHTGLLYAAGAAILAAISVAILLNSDAGARRPVGEDEQHQAADLPQQTALA